MGGLFSSPETNQADLEYQKSLAELQAEQKELETSILKAERTREQTLEQQYKRQKEIAQQRIEEIKESIRRAQELKDARKTLNIQAAVLLCALYYNYPFGTLDSSALDSSSASNSSSTISSDNSWQSNAADICNVAVNKETFWLMCKIPQLLPLFWFTGRTEDKFHQYNSRDSTGAPKHADYLIEINANIDAYINGPLKTYVSNVFQANCSRDITIDTDFQDELYEACANFIVSVQNLSNDDEWLDRAFAFIKNDDKMNWKGFAAKSGKGVCEKTIELLPSTFPKICPKYELYEALLMLSNTVINNYGQCKTANGYDVKVVRKVTGTKKVKKLFYELDSDQQKELTASGAKYSEEDVVEIDEETIELTTPQPDTNGGECFNIKQSYINNAYANAIDTTTIWDGKTFISTKSIVVPEEKITGSSDTKARMENTELYDELEVFYTNNGDRTSQTNGIVRYKNPTKNITHQFLNDVDGIIITFQMPRLSAGINANFRKSFLYNAYVALTTLPDNEQYDLYRTNNKYIFTSIDYMTVRPPVLDDWSVDDEVSSIARFIYTCLIEYSCKWDISIPIVTAMSMSQINGQILSAYNDKSYLPQYLWTRTNNLLDKVQSGDVKLSPTAAPTQVKSSTMFTANNVITV